MGIVFLTIILIFIYIVFSRKKQKKVKYSNKYKINRLNTGEPSHVIFYGGLEGCQNYLQHKRDLLCKNGYKLITEEEHKLVLYRLSNGYTTFIIEEKEN